MPAQFGGGGTVFKYSITVPEEGKYSLSARVVTVNYNQNLHVSVNGGESEAPVKIPYTYGKWQDTDPVTIINDGVGRENNCVIGKTGYVVGCQVLLADNVRQPEV